MNIAWLAEATRSLDEQLTYLAERNLSAALDMGDAIFASVRGLADAPHSARPGRVPGTRERIVTGTPYIIVYRIETDLILILRVLHGAQQWPPAR